MGDGVRGMRPKYDQGFPTRGESVQVGRAVWRLPSHGCPTSLGINLAAPWVRGVGGHLLNFSRGSPLGGKACGWEVPVGNSRSMDA